MSRCVVVIPTYNECENLPLLVPQVLAQDGRIEVLVVDDDSPDGTGKIADELAREEPRVHVLHRGRKEGLGPAYRAGIAWALEHGADWIVQMDADFSHPPSVLPTVSRPVTGRGTAGFGQLDEKAPHRVEIDLRPERAPAGAMGKPVGYETQRLLQPGARQRH